MSRRARERHNARPWEQGEQPEPEDRQHAGDFPEYDEQPLRCPNTEDLFGDDDASKTDEAAAVGRLHLG